MTRMITMGSITNKAVGGVVTVSRVRQMLDKSISAMFTTIEVYNKPTFEYREDTYSILAVNVWELLLNVRILQIDNNKISSIIDEVDKVLTRHYGFTDEELDFIPSASLRTQALTTTFNTVWARIGREILKDSRADYGVKMIRNLARYLIKEFGDGFGEKQLRHCLRAE